MSVTTLANFIAAVNAAAGKTSTYNASSPDANGVITISRSPSAGAAFVSYLKVVFSTQPDTNVTTDVNPNATQVIILGGNSGLSDSNRYCDAQALINMLNAN
jgi:hypothetical protein